MHLLIEDNTDIHKTLKYFDSIFNTLRKSNKIPKDILKLILDVMRDDIAYWMEEYWLDNTETPTEEEQRIINVLLDMINLLKKLE